jgi:uncharacterized membrane protein YgdD (TMEM256/DUF423 family)
MALSPSLVALRLGAFLGLLGVGLGAFAAHGLKPLLLQNGTVDIWQTAVFYQFIHAVALLALGRGNELKKAVVWCWSIGVVFFSGSLYFLAVFPTQKWLGPITPVGGALLIVGWGCLLWDFCRKKIS